MRGFLSGAAFGALISAIGVTAGSYLVGSPGEAPDAPDMPEAAAPMSETVPEAVPETGPEAGPETGPGAVTDPETDPATDPETDPATDPETDPATDPETDAVQDSETETETDAPQPSNEEARAPDTASPDPGADSAPVMMAESPPDTAPEPAPETARDTPPEASPDAAPDPGPAPGFETAPDSALETPPSVASAPIGALTAPESDPEDSGLSTDTDAPATSADVPEVARARPDGAPSAETVPASRPAADATGTILAAPETAENGALPAAEESVQSTPDMTLPPAPQDEAMPDMPPQDTRIAGLAPQADDAPLDRSDDGAGAETGDGTGDGARDGAGDAPVDGQGSVEDTAGLGVPVPQLDTLAPHVTTDRLPRIGAAEDDPAPAPAIEAAPGAGPALDVHAIPFEVAPESPIMSIVLLDPGAGRLPPASLTDFPVPLTIGIDPTLPGASEAMAAYRAAGQEVAVLTPLPEGAAPADVEVAFQVYLNAVPEAVAVLDIPEARLQENRPRAAQVSDILAETGHGLITYEKGLNSGLQVADSAGIPAVAVFRDFDDGTRRASDMKRLLDVGAFRAAQEGAVLMVGQLRAETIAALAEWVLGNRAATVTLAPASALLRSGR